MNWIKIKNEYITSDISYRKLAKKYNISINTLQVRAKRENWVELKRSYHDSLTANLIQKTEDTIIAKEVERLENILNLADKASEVLTDALKLNAKDLDTYKLRQIVQSIKDLKEIYKTDNAEREDGRLQELIEGLKNEI